jgi:hypothetical protein
MTGLAAAVLWLCDAALVISCAGTWKTRSGLSWTGLLYPVRYLRLCRQARAGVTWVDGEYEALVAAAGNIRRAPE